MRPLLRDSDSELDRPRVSRGLDDERHTELCDGVGIAVQAEQGGATAVGHPLLGPRRRDQRRLAGAARARDPLGQCPDQPCADDADRLAGRDGCAPHPLAADDSELQERGIVDRRARGNRIRVTGGHRDDRRVSGVGDSDEVSRPDMLDVSPGVENCSGGGVAGSVWIADVGVRQPEVLRPFGARADDARRHLDGHLVRAGPWHVDAHELHPARRRPDQGLTGHESPLLR